MLVRILKLLFTALAVLAAVIGGLFAAAVVAVTALTVFLTRRFLGKPRAALPRTPAPRAPQRPARDPSDAIEITATEVRETH